MALEEGYAFVSPRSSATARALLDAAKAGGLDASVVRTTSGGYYVPVAVSKKYEKFLGAGDEPVAEEPSSEEEKAPSPDDSWTNADIKAWAEDHQVDLGGATKKADMLAAITADTKEE